jgi:hypothetical protein
MNFDFVWQSYAAAEPWLVGLAKLGCLFTILVFLGFLFLFFITIFAILI